MRPLLLVVLALADVRVAAQEPERVTAEFRIFAGTDEITATTRLRLMPTGSRDRAEVIDEGKPLVRSVAPGVYDVQALRLRPEGIVAIRWAERLVVMHYPDEGGRHLEVINFEAGYGALQFRAASAPIAAYELTIYPAGDRTAASARPLEGDGYRLYVLKAGRYDIRVRLRETGDDPQDTRWLLDIEVPADRTRMKQVDVR